MTNSSNNKKNIFPFFFWIPLHIYKGTILFFSFYYFFDRDCSWLRSNLQKREIATKMFFLFTRKNFFFHLFGKAIGCKYRKEVSLFNFFLLNFGFFKYYLSRPEYETQPGIFVRDWTQWKHLLINSFPMWLRYRFQIFLEDLWVVVIFICFRYFPKYKKLMELCFVDLCDLSIVKSLVMLEQNYRVESLLGNQINQKTLNECFCFCFCLDIFGSFRKINDLFSGASKSTITETFKNNFSTQIFNFPTTCKGALPEM